MGHHPKFVPEHMMKPEAEEKPMPMMDHMEMKEMEMMDDMEHMQMEEKPMMKSMPMDDHMKPMPHQHVATHQLPHSYLPTYLPTKKSVNTG